MTPSLCAGCVRLSFPALSAIPIAQRAALDVEARVINAEGLSATERVHLSATRGSSVVLACVPRSHLAIEIWEPDGEQLAVAAAPPGALSASTGCVELALLCPDTLRIMGALAISFVRAGPALPALHKPPTFSPRVHLVPAGLLATGELAVAPPATTLSCGLRVSRNALSEPPTTDSTLYPLALALCAGDGALPGGTEDLNALAAAAIRAIDAGTGDSEVAILATADENLAAILVACAPDHVPIVWLGARGQARALHVASIHRECAAVMHIPRDGDALLPPRDFFSGARPRRRRSVAWADPLIKPPCSSCSSEELLCHDFQANGTAS